jgi:two-component system CheB/CheR fusion protein
MAKNKTPREKRRIAESKTRLARLPSAEPDPAPPEPQQPNFPIVGIGASAGGLAALEAFLSAMPANNENNFAVVVIQHLSPDHKSILSELLKRYTLMQVHEAQDGTLVEPNNAYIIPPNRDMALLHGRLQLFEIAGPRSAHFSIDFFFRSLSADLRERAICIVLSGTGTDGTLGVRAVKGEGGMAMAQTPESTEFDGMPRSAIGTGLIDYILPPAEMPAQLIAYVNQAIRPKLEIGAPSAPPSPEILAKIFVLLRAKTGHDFSQYKQNTIRRRVERRMALHQIERSSEYLRYMQEHAEEVSALFRDLLIGVTNFFRDPEAFAALETLAIPRIVASVPPGSAIRVWVCGCSTGEEAYSIAILIQEHLEKLQHTYKVQIFATDIDSQATDQARSGVFPASIAADVSAERLARFFKLEANGFYHIEKVIRDSLIFAEQDALKDPPFSKLNLVSCRNLLIYLNADLQKRLIDIFHYALVPDGMLLLGNSETTGDRPLLFNALDRKAKLYLRRAEEGAIVRPMMTEFPSFPPAARVAPSPLADPPRGKKKLSLREITEQSLLHHYSRAALLVDPYGEILYFHGRTGNYLEPAVGDAVSDVIAMAREGLRRDLKAALHRAVAKNEPVYLDSVQVKTNGHYVTVNLTILPIGNPAPPLPNLFLVILDEKPEQQISKSRAVETLAGSATAGEARIAALEHQLRRKDNYIQTIVEEMETSSEELKSSNEEMQSVNEEMQSTNEELETSREELQSVNEELATVNAQLRQKVADLSRANNDMNNLLAATGVGTLFVDLQLRIARFTPSITQVFNLIEADVGRPLAHIVSNLVGQDHLLADVQSVLNTLVPLEAEVKTKAGTWFILAVRPYRTLDNVIEGAVISFVDITARKLAQEKQLESERFRHAAQIETVGIAFFQIDGVITSANEAFLHMIDYTREELDAGQLDWSRITPVEWQPHSRKALRELKTTGKATPFEMQYLRKDGSRGKALFAEWRLDVSEAVVYVISIAPDH